MIFVYAVRYLQLMSFTLSASWSDLRVGSKCKRQWFEALVLYMAQSIKVLDVKCLFSKTITM